MKSKNIRLIMELIFIFIIPLLICCLCINVKDTYVYDITGNYNSSSKQIEFNSPFNLNVNTIETISNNNFTYNEQLDEEPFSYLMQYPNGYIDINFTSMFIDNTNISFNYYSIADESIYDGDFNYEFVLDFDYCYFYYTGNFYSILVNVSYFYNYLTDELGIIINDTDFITTNLYNLNIVDFNVITENEDLSIYGKIKSLIVNYLQVNDSVLIDFIITYTILWVLMFIIWHLFYRVFDAVAHLVKTKGD